MLSSVDITASQEGAIDALYEKNTLLIAQVGFGKAMVGQTAAQELLDDGELTRVLVIAPLKVCQLTWAKEWLKWDHLRQVGVAIGDAATRKAVIDSPAFDIVVINFENVVWLLAEYGRKHGFDGLLVDEISKFKGAGGVVLKRLRPRLGDFKWRCGMSATPVAESGIDIYAQALVIDKGRALGRNKELFLRKYFYPTDYQQYNWAILPGQDVVLAAALAPMVYVADDAAYGASLPELRDEVVNIELGAYARRQYEQMCKEAYLEDSGAEAVNEAVLSGKLQQITAGAVYSGPARDRKTVWIHEQKFDALERLLEAADGPVMVAYYFSFERYMLAERFPDMLFLGDAPGKVEQLWNTGKIPVVGVHPKSASHGLNLQYGGHELIVLTVPWGADPWQQLVGRLRRRGQVSPYVRRTVIVAAGTVDEVVLDRHVGKRHDEQSLMQHIAVIAGR